MKRKVCPLVDGLDGEHLLTLPLARITAFKRLLAAESLSRFVWGIFIHSTSQMAIQFCEMLCSFYTQIFNDVQVKRPEANGKSIRLLCFSIVDLKVLIISLPCCISHHLFIFIFFFFLRCSLCRWLQNKPKTQSIHPNSWRGLREILQGIYFISLRPKSSNLTSSVQRTCFQNASDCFRCSFANF